MGMRMSTLMSFSYQIVTEDRECKRELRTNKRVPAPHIHTLTHTHTHTQLQLL